MERLAISNTPHIRANATTKRIMVDVLIALAPAMLAGIIFFGVQALTVILISVAGCVASEWLYKLAGKKSYKQIIAEFDYTSVITGVLIGLSMPSNLPVYIPVFASVFAIVVVKMLFGGTGKNMVNPAIAGRLFVFIAFPIAVTSGWVAANITAIGDVLPQTGATVLGSVLNGDLSQVPSNLDLFLGTGISGCIGETSKLALLIGGIYLFVRRVIDWKPLVFIFVVGGLTVAIKGFDFNYFLPSILSGGLFLGAIFMASDYVTSPNTKYGIYVYYVLLGVLTALLRIRTGNEIVSYVILFGNLCVPLIDRICAPKPFGFERRKKIKEDK